MLPLWNGKACTVSVLSGFCYGTGGYSFQDGVKACGDCTSVLFVCRNQQFNFRQAASVCHWYMGSHTWNGIIFGIAYPMFVMCQRYFDFGVGDAVYGTDGSVSEISCAESSGYAAGDDLPLYRSVGGGGIFYGNSVLFAGEWSKVAGVQTIWFLCGSASAAQRRPCRAGIQCDAVPALQPAECEKNPSEMAGEGLGLLAFGLRFLSSVSAV